MTVMNNSNKLVATLLSALALLSVTNASSSISGNPQGCVSSVDSSIDYFPDKVSPQYSQYWTIEYANTYKILKNTNANTSYLLYLCGTTPPSNLATNFSATIPIPVNNVGISETPEIEYLQQLGKLNDVSVFLSDPSYVAAPCFSAMIQNGSVLVLQGSALQSPSKITNAMNASKFANMVTFTSPFSPVAFPNNVIVSEYAETTNQAIFEWLKFYSAFFNLEALANQVTQAASERWNCVAAEAGTVASDAAKPVVLWAYYSDYCSGWTVADCSGGSTSNYYCQYAAACHVDMLTSTAGSITACGSRFMTTEELVAFGKNASYWFYVSNNWGAVYGNFSAQLNTMNSVYHNQVFDYQGSGANAWFEERYAEYYDVLQDFCAVVGRGPTLGHNAWFRNVFTQPVGQPQPCNKNMPFNNANCANLHNSSSSSSNNGTTPTTTSTSDAAMRSMVNLLSTALVVMAVSLLTAV